MWMLTAIDHPPVRSAVHLTPTFQVFEELVAEDLQLLQVQVTQYGAGAALATEVQSMLDDSLIRLFGSSSSSRENNKAGGGVVADEDAVEDDGWLSEEEEGEAGRGWNATQQQWVDDVVAVAASEMAAIRQVWGEVWAKG